MKILEIDLSDITNLDNYIFWKMLDSQSMNDLSRKLKDASDESEANKILGEFFEWYENLGDIELKEKNKKKKVKKISKKKQKMQEEYLKYLSSKNED